MKSLLGRSCSATGPAMSSNARPISAVSRERIRVSNVESLIAISTRPSAPRGIRRPARRRSRQLRAAVSVLVGVVSNDISDHAAPAKSAYSRQFHVAAITNGGGSVAEEQLRVR